MSRAFRRKLLLITILIASSTPFTIAFADTGIVPGWDEIQALEQFTGVIKPPSQL